MWQRIRALIIKELLALWRDPKSRGILFVPPLVEMFIFSFVATQEVKGVHVAVLDQDQGTVSRDLIARFEGVPNFAELRQVASEKEIKRQIDSGEVLMALHFPADFSRRVLTGQPAPVQMILDGRRSNAAQIVAGYAIEIVTRFNAEQLAYNSSAIPASLVVSRIWFNPNQQTTWNSAPSLVGILTTLMGFVVTALTVARERELGTFEQLLVSPLSPREIIIGKTLPALFVGLCGATVMALMGVFVLRVPFSGSILLFYAATVVYLLAVIGVGLFVSSMAKTQQQAVLGTFIFMVPSMLLSGFASPIENMPDWLQTATHINPIRYYIVIVKGIFLKDLPAELVFANVWPMAIIGLVTLSAATWLFRHRME
jgi:drug efflux transport system permease protein